jgi:cobalt-zinc-cadmium efflux system protein
VTKGHIHEHSVSANADSRLVLTALCLIAGFFVAEIIAALLSASLALFADAAHMLTDVLALALSAWAIRLTTRPAKGRFTYGLHRAEILSAAVSGITLLAASLLLVAGAIDRLINPHHVQGGVVLVVAIVGALINASAAMILSKANRTRLNIKGAYLHVLTDLVAFAGTAVAGLIIVLTSFERADAIATLFVVVLMLRSAWVLLRSAGRVLLQAAPDDLDLEHVRELLLEIEHVLDVHDLHAWTLTSNSPTLSTHVVVGDDCFGSGHTPGILDELQNCVRLHFGVTHTTFQIEPRSHATHEEGLHH